MTYTTQDSLERLARFVFLLLLKRFSAKDDQPSSHERMRKHTSN